MSSSSNSYIGSTELHCYCQLVARVGTANTPQNYGRKYVNWPRFAPSVCRGCGFFAWMDAPFEAKATETIKRLVNQKNEWESKYHELEQQIQAKDEEIARLKSGSRLSSVVVLGCGCCILLGVVVDVMMKNKYV